MIHTNRQWILCVFTFFSVCKCVWGHTCWGLRGYSWLWSGLTYSGGAQGIINKYVRDQTLLCLCSAQWLLCHFCNHKTTIFQARPMFLEGWHTRVLYDHNAPASWRYVVKKNFVIKQLKWIASAQLPSWISTWPFLTQMSEHSHFTSCPQEWKGTHELWRCVQ